MTFWYLCAISLIALLSIAGYLTLSSVISNQDKTSSLINLSGRQRRWCVTISYYCSELAHANDDASRAIYRAKLLDAIASMDKEHRELTDEGSEYRSTSYFSPATRAIYFSPPVNLNEKVKLFLDKARKVAQANQGSNGDPNFRYVNQQGVATLLPALDLAVAQYEKEAKQKIAEIKNLDLILLLCTLSLITAEALFIFLPITRVIHDKVVQLGDSERKLNAIFDTVGDALITFAKDKKIVSANSRGNELFNRPGNDLVGQSVDKFLHQSKDLTSATDFKARYLESEIVRENGDVVPVEAVITQTIVAEEILVIAALRDITERKRAEKKIKEFYSIVAHELRTPMTAIQGSLQLLKAGKGGDLTEKGLGLVDAGLESSQRLVRLINDYLDLDKIVAGSWQLKPESLQLNDMVKTVASNLEGIATVRDIKISVSMAADSQVVCDRDSITQILTNLLSNAIKFSPDQASIDVRVDLAPDAHFVRCSVSDQGPGIAIADVTKLFGKFQQTSTATMVKEKGTGLGLAITKALVEQNGGNIGVDISARRGATFWFELPRKALSNSEGLSEKLV
jgi:PAS domain S-box-containing protein